MPDGRSGKRGRSSLFKEPLWLGYQHDGHPWSAFSEYRKIRKASPTTGRGEAAILQSWLTLGLLESVTEQQIPEATLVKITANGRPIMSKDGLPEILRGWVHRLERTDKEELEAWWIRMNATLRRVHTLLLNLLSVGTLDYPSAEVDDVPATVCLIGLIAEALSQARLAAESVSLTYDGISWTFVVEKYQETYQKEMAARGWCPFTVNYLIRALNVACMDYASTLEETPGGGKSHDACSSDRCVAYVVDVDSYVASHVTSTCSCTWSKPSLEAVSGLLYDDKVPVISSLESIETSTFQLPVKDGSIEPAYIAVSHVWADGQGSTTEEGLPTCQVQVLRSRFRGIPFWMDSLCVPQRPNVRKRAIGLMAKTYREAAAVLVLDKDILATSSSVPTPEKLLRILCSGWMQRLWTLQEAILAQTLVFQFSDGSGVLQELVPGAKEIPLDPLKAGLAIEIHRLTKQTLNLTFRFGDVSRLLHWRSTSKPEDETIAIASLLHVDTRVLIDLPTQGQRMVALLSTVGNMPKNIVLLDSPKLSTPRFRWAPVSLMARQAAQMSTTDDAVCTPEGLVAEYHVLRFKPRTLEAGQKWALMDASNIYLVSDAPQNLGTYRCNALLYTKAVVRHMVEPCVAVLEYQKQSSAGKEGDTMFFCEYVRPLLIRNIAAATASVDITVATVLEAGTMKVCLA